MGFVPYVRSLIVDCRKMMGDGDEALPFCGWKVLCACFFARRNGKGSEWRERAKWTRRVRVPTRVHSLPLPFRSRIRNSRSQLHTRQLFFLFFHPALVPLLWHCAFRAQKSPILESSSSTRLSFPLSLVFLPSTTSLAHASHTYTYTLVLSLPLSFSRHPPPSQLEKTRTQTHTSFTLLSSFPPLPSSLLLTAPLHSPTSSTYPD